MAITRLSILKKVARKSGKQTTMDTLANLGNNILEGMDTWAIQFGEWLESASMTNPKIPVHIKYQMFKDQREKK